MKIKINKLTLCSVFFISSILWTGCYNVIFAKIVNEVKLEDATISGRINSIIRYTYGDEECIFVQNGIIYYKKAAENSHTAWNECMNGIESVSYKYYGNGFTGTYISKLAADKNTLYAIGIKLGENKDKGENIASEYWLYYFDTTSSVWKEVQNVTSSTGTTTIFSTNTVDSNNRRAYIRMNGKVYDLEGAASSTFKTVADSLSEIPNTKATTSSAVYFKSQVYFFDTVCSGTNETASTPATHIYYADESKLQWSDNASTYIEAVSCSSAIISMAVTSDAIILGTERNGLAKVVNTSGVPGSATVEFETNASAALESPYEILAMLCVDSDQPEKKATIYASADFRGTPSSSKGSYNDVGLWSYYESRGNWNRE
ncbi:MAG: hypothetical protein J6I73_00495 [Treponema sp.]|nr:hypothetical protein [Treponema sp.]